MNVAKKKFRLEDLSVTSFDTLPTAMRSSKGTVIGAEYSELCDMHPSDLTQCTQGISLCGCPTENPTSSEHTNCYAICTIGSGDEGC